MSRLTSQLESMFTQSKQKDNNNSQEEESELQDVIEETQNSDLDEKERLMSTVKQNYDKIKDELGEILQSQWNTKITEIKQNMLIIENEKQKSGGKND